MDERETIISILESLAPAQVDYVFDADLDELTVLFFGPVREAYVAPASELLSLLRDVTTDKVVGAVFSQFLHRVVEEVPELRDVIPSAMVITDDFAGPLDEILALDPVPSRGVEDLVSGAKAARHQDDAAHLRDVVKGVQAFG